MEFSPPTTRIPSGNPKYEFLLGIQLLAEVLRPAHTHPLATAQQPLHPAAFLFPAEMQKQANSELCINSCYGRDRKPFSGKPREGKIIMYLSLKILDV
jgi:hypothetical protein